MAHSLRAEGFDASEDGTGRGIPLIPSYWDGGQVADCLDKSQIGKGQMMPEKRRFAAVLGFDPTNRQPEYGHLDDKAPTMKVGRRSPLGVVYQCHGSNVGPIDSQGGYAPGQGGTVVFDETQVTSKENRSRPEPNDPCHPLAAGARSPTVAFIERTRKEGRTLEAQEELAYAITNPGGGGRAHSRQILDTDLCVRRLTPRECERLQGFPDDFTLIEYGRGGGLKKHEVEEMAEYWGVEPKDAKKIAADGPRYRALGNAMAVDVMFWIGYRIERVLALTGEPE